MFRDMLKSSASYEAYAGLDTHGDATYSAATTVACRLERAVNLVRTEDGDSLVTNHVYFLGFEPAEGSKLDGRTIVAFADNPELSGDTTVWEVYC